MTDVEGWERVPSKWANALGWVLSDDDLHRYDEESPASNGPPTLFRSPIKGVIPSDLYLAACEQLQTSYPHTPLTVHAEMNIIRAIERLMLDYKEGRITRNGILALSQLQAARQAVDILAEAYR